MNCEKVRATNATTEAFIDALRRQHMVLDACNERQQKVREIEAQRVSVDETQ